MSEAELHGGTVVDATEKKPSVSFLPERFVRRETEALARRLETKEEADKYNDGDSIGPNVGDWVVTDDRGHTSIIPDEEFRYFYEENEAHGGPGKINILLPGMNALGCRAVIFGLDPKLDLDRELNEWFERPEHFGLAIADMKPLPDGRTLVFVTRPLTEREIKERAEVAEETRAIINKKHEQALEQQALAIANANRADEERKAKEAEELARLRKLAPIAERHIANCKGGKNG